MILKGPWAGAKNLYFRSVFFLCILASNCTMGWVLLKLRHLVFQQNSSLFLILGRFITVTAWAHACTLAWFNWIQSINDHIPFLQRALFGVIKEREGFVRSILYCRTNDGLLDYVIYKDKHVPPFRRIWMPPTSGWIYFVQVAAIETTKRNYRWYRNAYCRQPKLRSSDCRPDLLVQSYLTHLQ